MAKVRIPAVATSVVVAAADAVFISTRNTCGDRVLWGNICLHMFLHLVNSAPNVSLRPIIQLYPGSERFHVRW